MTPRPSSTAFTARHEALLEALARYRFLTIPLAVRLGVGDRSRVRESLAELETRRLVNVARREKSLGKPYVFTLSARGAALLEEWAAEGGETRTVPVRKSPVRVGAGLDQKLCTVSALMALDAWAAREGASVGRVVAEYDPHPQGLLQAATAVEFEGVKYTADALAQIRAPDGEEWLFALEVETGGIEGRIDNFRAHLPARLEVFSSDVLDNALGWPETNRAARCLFIFDTADLLAAAQRLVAGSKGDVWRKVLLNTLPNVERDFAAGWWRADGTAGSLFR